MRKNLIVLFSLLSIITSIPYLLDTVNFSGSSKNNELYIQEIDNSPCQYRYTEVENNLVKNGYSIEKVAKDIYVFPEFKNINCLGKVLEIVSEPEINQISLVIGTNEKVSQYLKFGLYFSFILILLLLPKKDFLSYFIPFQLIFFNIDRYLDFESYYFQLFIYSWLIMLLIYYFKFFQQNDSFLFFSPMILIPVFYVIHFLLRNEKVLIEVQVLVIVILFSILFIFIKYKNKDIFIFPMLFVVSLIMNFTSFTKPLKDVQPFRQNQNALSARTMFEDGLTINTPLPVFGLTGKLPFEFPFLQLLSGFFQKIGIPEIYTLRPLAWVAYLLFIFFTYKVVLLFNDKNLASLVVIFMLFHPTLYHYSNSYMIEFMPHVFGLLALIKFQEDKKHISAVFLTLSLLAKGTTGIVYLLLLLILYVKRKKYIFSEVFLISVIVLVPNIIWNLFAENVKNSNEQTAWLASSNLVFWNFVSEENIINPKYWLNLFDFYLSTFWDTKYFFIMGILFLLFMITHNKLILITLVPVLIFSNLYTSHYYYLIAIIPFLIYFVCLFFYEKVNSNKLQYILVLVIICFSSFGQIHQSIGSKVYDEFNNEQLSDTLIAYSQPNVYLASYYDWNSTIFFESHKRGIMWQPRFQELGKQFANNEFIENNIELFVAQKNFLDQKHFYDFINYALNKNHNLQIDTYEKHRNILFLSSTDEIKTNKIYISKLSDHQTTPVCSKQNFQSLSFIDEEYNKQILNYLILNKDYVLIIKTENGVSKLSNYC
jgi:hypothetical protein